MDSAKIPGNDFLDILFYGRNKDYGAYELRSRYDRRVRNAVMGTASIMLVMIGGYVLNNTLMAAENVHRPVLAEKKIELQALEIPPEPPVTIPPPPVTSAPPPLAASVRVTTPVIVDSDVPPDEMPPKNADIGTKVVGFTTSEGVEGGMDIDLNASGNGNSGVITVANKAADADGPLNFVEIMPEFPGGERALAKYLGNNIRYPHLAQENEIQGIVYIQFVVNRDGTISQVKTTGAAKGGGLEEEAIRVISKLPKWKPGRQNGQYVAVYFNLPVNFKLSGN
ncbi:energy transducer TonB [Chitinophaga ginsengisegetis]|uniref:energy transducer TonB n=1 Tax=Chitinophaga ginsengisegetis TaxID=393003 RepID=UPI000DBF697B|nr:energy transducer TonB [Chitinophaga ginsengisegetis]MDR6566626.1 protein TonB [Chitinophaga ginsengisegetis]MDR6646356.1 protein TonB [Chitinophaga ginsengisegetis]MDR6652706.1 protein TonB [Chitinophaga ginsengisegetis]